MEIPLSFYRIPWGLAISWSPLSSYKESYEVMVDQASTAVPECYDRHVHDPERYACYHATSGSAAPLQNSVSPYTPLTERNLLPPV
jgi:hypothetical protein